MIWPHFTKESPCPACKHHDWQCRQGEKMFICMRVESKRPAKSGGWYHFYDEEHPYIPQRPANRSIPSVVDLGAMLARWRMNTSPAQIESLAGQLGVTVSSLRTLGCCWADKHNAWAFPMHDSNRNVIGIRLRNNDGKKWAVIGGKGGLFTPSAEHWQDTVFLPEGPTDTAALISMGFYAWGRPNCMAGNEIIKEAVKLYHIRKAVIVSDNDELKQVGDKEQRPGLVGAKKLKSEIGIKSVIFIPPTKDIRDYLKNGATKEMVMTIINKKVWTI
jgi:hypothetical protein